MQLCPILFMQLVRDTIAELEGMYRGPTAFSPAVFSELAFLAGASGRDLPSSAAAANGTAGAHSTASAPSTSGRPDMAGGPGTASDASAAGNSNAAGAHSAACEPCSLSRPSTAGGSGAAGSPSTAGGPDRTSEPSTSGRPSTASAPGTAGGPDIAGPPTWLGMDAVGHLAIFANGEAFQMSALPPPSGLPGRPCRLRKPINVISHGELITFCKDCAIEAQGLIVTQLEERFPPHRHLDAFSICDPRFFPTATLAAFNLKVKILGEHYGRNRPFGTSSTAAALIDENKLTRESGLFFTIARPVAEAVLARHAAALDLLQKKEVYQGPSLTTMFWTSISHSFGERVPTFLQLARIGLGLATGGVEDERTFSSLVFVKNNYRSRLEEAHLNVCLRLFSSKQQGYSLDNFPLMRAYTAWSEAKLRRGEARVID